MPYIIPSAGYGARFEFFFEKFAPVEVVQLRFINEFLFWYIAKTSMRSASVMYILAKSLSSLASGKI